MTTPPGGGRHWRHFRQSPKWYTVGNFYLALNNFPTSFDLYYAYFQGSRISGPPRDFIEEKSSFYCLFLNETWNACLDGPKLAQRVIKKLDDPKLVKSVIKNFDGPKLAQRVIHTNEIKWWYFLMTSKIYLWFSLWNLKLKRIKSDILTPTLADGLCEDKKP